MHQTQHSTGRVEHCDVPTCARCGRAARSLRNAPDGRLCSQCAARTGDRNCDRCGRLGRVAVQRSDGVTCYRCFQKDPEVAVSTAEGMRANTTRQVRWERTGADEHAAAQEEARAALLLGQMVYDRRIEPGLTQAELCRAGRHDPAAALAPGVRRGDADRTAARETATALKADLDIAPVKPASLKSEMAGQVMIP